MPTFFDQVVFQAKASVFRVARGVRELGPSKCKKWPLQPCDEAGGLLAESRSVLWDLSAPHAERVLQAGKVQNLRLAARKLDGCRVPGGQCFSFWRQVGWPGRMRGYVRGRELRQGCLVPAVAGGLCQLSNALYDAALLAGFSIHERHAHSQVVAGSLAEKGRDATIFWNYVDLRFSSEQPFRIGIAMTEDELIVQLWRDHAC